MGGAAAAVGAAKAGFDIYQGIKQGQEVGRAKGNYQDTSEQVGLRHEATYRQDRQMLMGAIQDYYKKQGWEIPQAAPGAGTGRPLPGDPALYPGYNTPMPGPWQYTQEPQAAGAVPAPAAPPPQEGSTPVEAAAGAEGAPQMTVQPPGQPMTRPALIPAPGAVPGGQGAPLQMAQGPGIQQIAPANAQENLKLIASRLGGQYGY